MYALMRTVRSGERERESRNEECREDLL